MAVLKHSGSEMQKLYSIIHSEVLFKTVWFYTVYRLSPQHKQVNDELVQSSRNLFNQFCHQRKYVFYQTQIYIFFKTKLFCRCHYWMGKQLNWNNWWKSLPEKKIKWMAETAGRRATRLILSYVCNHNLNLKRLKVITHRIRCPQLFKNFNDHFCWTSAQKHILPS